MEKDVLSKEFFSVEERYADVINGLGCGGRQVVSKDDLQEMDSRTRAWSGMSFAGKRHRGREKDGIW